MPVFSLVFVCYVFFLKSSCTVWLYSCTPGDSLKVIGFVFFCSSLFGEKSICMPGSCLISQQSFWGFAMKILNVNENCYDIAKSLCA